MAMGSRSTSVSDKDDLSVAWEQVKTEVGGEYQTVLFKNRSPLSHGFPILRPRFYIVGVKGTSHDAHELQRIAEQTSKSISSECPVPPSYLRFLNIENYHLNWDRLYCLSLGVCISRLSVALIVAVTVNFLFLSCACAPKSGQIAMRSWRRWSVAASSTLFLSVQSTLATVRCASPGTVMPANGGMRTWSF